MHLLEGICSLTCCQVLLGKEMNRLAATKISSRGARIIVRVEIPGICTEENTEQTRDRITGRGEGILPDTGTIIGSRETDGLIAADAEVI